jgi:hypothetical protein
MLRQCRLFITGTQGIRLSRSPRRYGIHRRSINVAEAWLDALETGRRRTMFGFKGQPMSLLARADMTPRTF